MSPRDLRRRQLCLLALTASAAGPAAHAQQGRSGTKPEAGGFGEPATAGEYIAAMRLGTQACDFLEMAYEAAGLPNQVGAADFDVMRKEGQFDHIRIPANCAARADVNGLISEAFLAKLDAQVKLALERFERVVLDPLHHYNQWKGDHQYDKVYDDYVAVAALTADGHAARATAMWSQLATRYRDASLRLSFDLFNEPLQRRQGDFPPGLTAVQLDDWHAAVIPAIRATGGRNAQRMIWLEPWDNQLDLLAIPAKAGPIGVSPHYYSPFGFTHGGDPMRAAGLASFVEDVAYARHWGQLNGVPIWIGETGVSRNIARGRAPRPDAERAEYTAHVRSTALEARVPVCYWGYNSAFAQYDQSAHAWLPSMQQAVTGLPRPFPVRPVPSFLKLKGGHIAKGFYANSVWPGFSYDPATGVLSARTNDTGKDISVVIVFPEVPVASMQSWIVRAREFTGSWRVGACAFFHDAALPNQAGVPGLDRRALNSTGASLYPGFRPMAPGGFDNAFGAYVSTDTVLGVDLLLLAGSPAGHIDFSCLQSA